MLTAIASRKFRRAGRHALQSLVFGARATQQLFSECFNMKRHSYSGNLNTETPGDSKNVFLPCGDVFAHACCTLHCTALYDFMTKYF